MKKYKATEMEKAVSKEIPYSKMKCIDMAYEHGTKKERARIVKIIDKLKVYQVMDKKGEVRDVVLIEELISKIKKNQKEKYNEIKKIQ
jgi:alpha-D-ribose 1-methylphosphonate 5-triphosphate synthase subunit PhnG